MLIQWKDDDQMKIQQSQNLERYTIHKALVSEMCKPIYTVISVYIYI